MTNKRRIILDDEEDDEADDEESNRIAEYIKIHGYTASVFCLFGDPEFYDKRRKTNKVSYYIN